MTKLSDSYNFRAITAALTTSGQPTEALLRAAASEGYEVVINLALHDDPRYSLPDEKDCVEGLGLVYVHIPVQFGAPQEQDLLAFFLAMEMYNDKKIHLHCAANMRATAFLGIYHMIKSGQSETEAFEPMRDIWDPDEVWASFIANMIDKFVRPGAPASAK